jgi:predicted HTH transcriptional regulator
MKQFKRDITNIDSLAVEMVAFSNSKGGTIFIGVDDQGAGVGLSARDTGRINQIIGNCASQHVRSPIFPTTENVSVGGGKALAEWPGLEFRDDHEGCLFTAIVHRNLKGQAPLNSDPDGWSETPVVTGAHEGESRLSGHNYAANDLINENRDLLTALAANPRADYQTIAESIGTSAATVKRRIQQLKLHRLIRRVGSRKTGQWEVPSPSSREVEQS